MEGVDVGDSKGVAVGADEDDVLGIAVELVAGVGGDSSKADGDGDIVAVSGVDTDNDCDGDGVIVAVSEPVTNGDSDGDGATEALSVGLGLTSPLEMMATSAQLQNSSGTTRPAHRAKPLLNPPLDPPSPPHVLPKGNALFSKYSTNPTSLQRFAVVQYHCITQCSHVTSAGSR